MKTLCLLAVAFIIAGCTHPRPVIPGVIIQLDPNGVSTEKYHPQEFERKCLEAVFSDLEKTGPLGKKLSLHLRKRAPLLPSDLIYKAALCHADFSSPAAVEGRGNDPRDTKAFREDQLGLFVHEGHHLLGTMGDLAVDAAQKKQKLRSFTTVSSFKYFAASLKDDTVKLPTLPGTPKTKVACEALNQIGFKKFAEIYFCKDSDNDFYLVLDEWNAYLQTSFFEYEQFGPCPSHQWPPLSPMVFYIAATIYLEIFRESKPDLFHQVLKEERVRSFLNYLKISTEKAAQNLCGSYGDESDYVKFLFPRYVKQLNALLTVSP